MYIDIEKYLKDLTLDDFLKYDTNDNLQKAIYIYEKLTILVTENTNKESTGLKIITVMTFAILSKISKGKETKNFDTQDWTDILRSVSEYAILQDDTSYVVSVFKMYEKYIHISADSIQDIASKHKIHEIHLLANELAEQCTLLEDECISETIYIERCLWISLEAMIKLLAATASKHFCEEYSDLAYALATYAFEYGRMSLYTKEQQLLNEFIAAQYELDNELQLKYNKFIEELTLQSNYFITMIDNAFAPNFREQFLASAALAKSIGVPDSEILSTIDEIDSFFE